MPLLRRKPFERIKLPNDLKADEEVFHCKLTNEIFRDYNEFYERVILCNSLVWTCALTGKPNLTYGEAKESEQAARKLVEDYPKELHVPTLYLANLTQRTSFLDLVEDVFSFCKERYFVGEKVEVRVGQNWLSGSIVKVIAPNKESTNPSHGKSPSKIVNSGPPSDPQDFTYEVISNSKEWSGKKLLTASDLKRVKGLFTREKNKLFLRLNVESGSGGLMKVKEYAMRRYKISSVLFHTIFAGPEPSFVHSKRAIKATDQSQLSQAEKEQRRKDARNQRRKEKRREIREAKGSGEQQSSSRKSRNSESPQKSTVTPKGKPGPKKSPTKSATKQSSAKKLSAEEVKQRQIEKERLKKEQERLRKQQERARAREKQREEKRRLAEFYKEWSRIREDLECEDLKNLPTPCTVQCRIPNHLFGDFVMVLEFLSSFKDLLSVKNFFSQGVQFEVLERALVENEVAGPLSDLLQMLLSKVFELQEEEEAEVQDADSQANVGLRIDEAGSCEEAIRSATAAANWSQTFQGCSIDSLALDSLTLTEVLRLHLLSSGGRSTEANSTWRFQQRGGYTLLDDPGLMLRINEPQILRALSILNVSELSIGEKLQIISCLIHQILMFADMRDLVHDRVDKLKQARSDLRNLQFSEQRREREEAIKLRQERIKDIKEEVEGVTAETTPPLNAEQEQVDKARREKEVARKRQDYLKRERDLQEKVAKLEWSVSAQPIGCDRAYRRFWLFPSLPGLFVEHDDDFVGPCLQQPTPYSKSLLPEDSMEYVRRLFESHQQSPDEANSSGSSDKENESGPLVSGTGGNPTGSGSAKKLLSEKNGSHPNSKPRAIKMEVKEDEAENDTKVSPVFGLCTSEQDICPVHSTVLPKVRWAFYNRPEELEALLGSLNQRGLREGELRQTLLSCQLRLEKSMQTCPAHLLGREEDEVVENETRKSSRQNPSKQREDANLNYPPGTSAAQIFEDTLRDMILEMEEKIQLGGLGSLKVKNREVWREKIAENSYDKQCEKLVWGGKGFPSSKLSNAQDKFLGKLKSEEKSTSRPGTPDSASIDSGPRYEDPGGPLPRGREEGLNLQQGGTLEVPVAVKNFASAMLQLEQAIEGRYLKKPLGEDEKEKVKRQKLLLAKKKARDESGSPDTGSEDGEGDEKPLAPQLERWEVSLMASTSFPQLFLHFSTLENSVQWSKSILNARCRLCRRKGDGEKMLLCDGCNKGHHMYCLKPKLTNVPSGEWFCQSCKPKEVKPPTPRKSRRIFSAEESEEEEEEDDEEEEEDEAEDDEEGSDEEQQESGSDVGEECAVCGSTGDMVNCEECTRSFHLACAEPPLRKVPRGQWTCQDCRGAHQNKGLRQKKNGAVVIAQQSLNLRRSARDAKSKITNIAKRLRSNSWDDTDSSRAPSETANEDSVPTLVSPSSGREQRVRRRPRWLEMDEDIELPLNTGALHALLADVMAHSEAWPFLRPVLKQEAPDYHQIIKRPMDFGTIKYKLNLMDYRNNSEFLADALLVFENCQMYNQSDADEFKAGVLLHKFFEIRCRELGLKLREDELEPPDAKKPRRQI